MSCGNFVEYDYEGSSKKLKPSDLKNEKAKSGGYCLQLFIESPPEDFTCPICMEVFRNPLQCSFGHTFCESCIQKHLESTADIAAVNLSPSSSSSSSSYAPNDGSICPSCRTPIEFKQLQKNLIVRNVINSLRVRCWTNVLLDSKYIKSKSTKKRLLSSAVSESTTSAAVVSTTSVTNDPTATLLPVTTVCTWEGKLNELEHHLRNECLLTMASCHHPSCTFKSVRHELFSKHLPTCGHQIILCNVPGCFESFPLKDKDQHLSICKYNNISCPNKCGFPPVHFENAIEMTRHVELECPLQYLPCPLLNLTTNQMNNSNYRNTNDASISHHISSSSSSGTQSDSANIPLSTCGCTNEGMILRKDLQSHLSDPKLLQLTLSTCLMELVKHKERIVTLENDNNMLRLRVGQDKRVKVTGCSKANLNGVYVATSEYSILTQPSSSSSSPSYITPHSKKSKTTITTPSFVPSTSTSSHNNNNNTSSSSSVLLLPLYRKIDDPDKWLEYYKNKWQIKPTKFKGSAKALASVNCGVSITSDGHKPSPSDTPLSSTSSSSSSNTISAAMLSEFDRMLPENITGIWRSVNNKNQWQVETDMAIHKIVNL